MSNKLFNPNEKIIMECEYFQVKNTIFDEDFTVRATKRYKENGKFVKDKMLIEYRELDIYEITTYIYLCRCANNKDNAFPSYGDIAKKIKCGRTKAIECIRVLNENGFIYKENRFNKKGEKKSNIYYINTKLSELKVKLDTLYANKREEIITITEVSSSDELPSLSDELGGGLSDELGSVSDDHKKEQLKNNNIKKEQLNNNKSNDTKKDIIKTTTKKKTNSVVVDKEIINLKDKLFVLLNIKFTDKEIESIIKALKTKFNSINEEAIKNVCNLINNSKTEIKNVVAYIITAIKNDYKETNFTSAYKNKNLKFNNFDQREYDYADLEKKLLGWEN